MLEWLRRFLRWLFHRSEPEELPRVHNRDSLHRGWHRDSKRPPWHKGRKLRSV